MNQRTTKYYDKNTHAVESVTEWEEEDLETGEIIHHTESKTETYRGPKYLRVFPEALRLATMALDKNSYKALMFIMPRVISTTNIASVSYSDLEVYLDISNQAVAKIMGSLQKADIIRNWKRGQWMLNPTVAAGGYELRRAEMISIYFGLKNIKCPEGIDYTRSVRKARAQTKEALERNAYERYYAEHAAELGDEYIGLPDRTHRS